MTASTKATKAADAIKRLDDSALVAQDRILAAAEKAQKIIDDACTAATKALEDSSRPDRRNLNGSYNWDRDNRRSFDARVERIEGQIDELKRSCGSLSVGQARRETQISELSTDVKELKKEVPQLRDKFESSHDALAQRFDVNIGVVSKKFDDLLAKFEDFSASNKTWLIGVMITVIMAMVFIISSRFIP